MQRGTEDPNQDKGKVERVVQGRPAPDSPMPG